MKSMLSSLVSFAIAAGISATCCIWQITLGQAAASAFSGFWFGFFLVLAGVAKWRLEDMFEEGEKANVGS